MKRKKSRPRLRRSRREHYRERDDEENEHTPE